MREYICAFCLEVTPTEPSEDGIHDKPDFCNHCKTASCDKCGAFLKGQSPKFCYGCGAINPKVYARFNSTTSTAGVYMEDEWRRRNKGRGDGGYVITTGYEDGVGSRISSWVCKRNADNTKYEQVRELTDEEKNFIKGE